jgi:hypothetical protein
MDARERQRLLDLPPDEFRRSLLEIVAGGFARWREDGVSREETSREIFSEKSILGPIDGVQGGRYYRGRREAGRVARQ